MTLGWKTFVPRPVLYALISLLGAVGLYYEREWRSDLTGRVRAFDNVSSRMTAVEIRQEIHSAEIEIVREAVNDMRRDQLSFYRWQAERAGHWEKARELDERLKSLEEKR